MQSLFDAIQANRPDEVARILQLHPDWTDARLPSGVSPISLAVYLGLGPLAELMRPFRNQLDFFEACLLGDESVVRAELKRGQDVNACAPDGFTPLGLAVYFGRTALVPILLDAGANVNACARNAQQVGPIHAAVSRGDVPTLELLLARGADPNLPQRQQLRPLHVAAANGSAAAAALLLFFGARANVRTDGGKLPSELAREHRHEALAERLAQREAAAPD